MKTIQTFRKGEVIKDFYVEDGKVLKTLEIGGRMVSNPTLEMMYADGWEDWVRPAPKPYIPTREEKINREIRERYTENDEFMILRQYSAHPENPEYKAAFDEYNAYVETILAKYPEEDE